MQQDFSQNFHVNDLDKLTRRGSITYASAYDQANAGNVTNGSYFTEAWCKGLQMEALPTGTDNPNDYADQLGGGAESINLLVSLSEAQLYAQQIIEKHINDFVITSPINSSQINQNRSNDPNYLGKPTFLIRDGDQQTPAEYKHESPDIYINVIDNDLYNVGDNTVYISIKNNGTHPVRTFWIGTKHFGSGLGSSDAWNIENPSVPASLPAVLKAGDGFLLDYELNYDPLGATHRCILARASLEEIVQTSLDQYSDWAYTINDFEAQRNIDPVPAPPPVEPPPAPDEANDPPQDPPPEPEPEPEPDPDPDTEEPDQSGGGSKSVRNIRGLKEHIYHIKNPFKEKRKFLLVFPDFYDKYRELFDIKWFELVDEKREELLPLRILDKPSKHIPLDIEPGENKKILFYLAMKPKVRFEETIKLPFEILVEKPQTLLYNLRLPVAKKFWSTHVSISGLTVAIKQAAGTIRASVWNKDRRPLPGALLFIKTVNGRQAAVLRTGKSGTIILRNINPDVYKISVETDRWHSVPKFINLREKDDLKIDFFEKEGLRGKKVKVILDRIKILDDKDPLIFGKGEIKFTSLVMPDQDESRKQVVNLPEKGVYRVSDKSGKNEIDLGVTIFDGYALDNLVIGIAGKEVDWFGRDDKFRRYFRSFIGNPTKWYGKYQPGDEYRDKENVGDWQLWYRIVRE